MLVSSSEVFFQYPAPLHSVTLSAMCFKAMVPLLLIHCLLLLPLFVEFCVKRLVCFTFLSIIINFCNPLAEDNKAGCFTLIICLMC